MSPRPDVSAQRIPQILNAAAAVFGAKGLGDATVADIAEAAGLSKALVFKYFRSKDELVLALVRSLFETLPGPRRNAGESCRQALLEWCDASARVLDESPAFAAIAAEFLALASREGGARDIVFSAYAGLLTSIAALIAEGMAETEFRPADAERAALAIIAQLEGANLLHLVGAAGGPLREAYRDGVELLLDGLAATPRAP